MPGVTPNRSLRYPLFGEPSLPSIQQEQLAVDLDTAFTTTDGLRTAALHRPRASIRSSLNVGSGQVIAKGAVTGLTYNTLNYDNTAAGNFADLANNRLVCRTAGVYLVQVGAVADFSASMTTPCCLQIAISRNGSTSLPDFQPHKMYTPDMTAGFLDISISAWSFMVLAVSDTLTSNFFWTAANTPTLNVAAAFLSATMWCTNP